MTTQRRTLELTEDEWAEVEAALLDAARRNRARADQLGAATPAQVAADNRADVLMLAARQVQAAGAAQVDGGPVGTARYSIR